jgi:hypothetical protein
VRSIAAECVARHQCPGPKPLNILDGLTTY